MFNFWSIITSLLLGLFGLGQLHQYIVEGRVPEHYEKAPEVLRTLIESKDRTNAKRISEAAAYSLAAGERMVIPGDLKRSVNRLTGREQPDRFERVKMRIVVEGLSDSEVLRAMRFLALDASGYVSYREEGDTVVPPAIKPAESVRPNIRRLAKSRSMESEMRLGASHS